MSHWRIWPLPIIAFVAAQSPASADPVFDIGSSFTVSGTNAPNNSTQTVRLTPGTTTIDSGALNFTQAIVDKSGGEWLILTFQTTSGADIAGSQSAFWDITASGILLSHPSNETEFFLDFGENGVLASPTSDFGGISLLGVNPVTGTGNVFGGTITGENGITVAPGTGASISPFSFLGASGINPLAVDEFEDAIFLTPSVPVPTPEPSSLWLSITALIGLGLVARRRRV